MTQDEPDRLLRPRVTSQATAIPVTASDPVAASVLPETSSVAAAPSIPRRRLILKCLLFGGAIYTSLLLFWSVTHLNTTDGSDAHTTFQSAVNTVVSEAKELQLMRTEFLLTTTGSAKGEVQIKATLVSPVREEKPTEQPEESPANDQASELDPKDAITQAEEHARVVKMLPADEKVKRRLKCIGWRATSHCSPHGPREPENDKGCYSGHGDFERKPRISVLAFINVDGVIDYFNAEGTFDRVLFTESCQRFVYSSRARLQMHPGRNSVWILDGASIHRDPEIVTYLRSVGVVPIFLPAYCPFFNPIEFMFGYMKRSFQRHYAESSKRDLLPFVIQTFRRFENFDMSKVYEHCGWSVQGTFNPIGPLSYDRRPAPQLDTGERSERNLDFEELDSVP